MDDLGARALGTGASATAPGIGDMRDCWPWTEPSRSRWVMAGHSATHRIRVLPKGGSSQLLVPHSGWRHVAGTCASGCSEAPDATSGPPGVDLDPPPDRNDLIAYGPLLSDAGDTWLGTAALVRSPDPRGARALLTQERYVDIEVRSWQFGGRP